MPTLKGRGPFSYESLNFNSGNTYTLNAGSDTAPKTQFDSTNGETLEVFADGTLLEGDGSVASAVDAAGESPAHGFFVNSLSAPTSVTLVSNISAGEVVLIRRISNRSSPEVDFAPGSVIREQDLDDSTNQTLHVAQEAIDIALQSMVVDADDKWDAQTNSINRVIKNVASGVADTDAANVSQMNATEVATEGFMDTAEEYKEDTEDYKLEAGDWAQKDDGAVKAYVDNATPGSALGFSAKAHAIGGVGVDVETGSAMDWATKATTPSSTAADASAKEWATGVSTHKLDASAKEYATHAQYGTVDGSSGYSAKHHATQSKDWATKATIVRNDANDGDVDYASKEWAIGQLAANTDGSAKQWSIGGGAFVEGTAVTGSSYSAKKYASDSAASASAASTSEGNAAGYVDAFDDDYLGSHTTASRETGANVGKDNDGDALADGALYYDTTLEVMKVWNDTGSAWQQMQPTTAEMATINAVNLDAVDIGKVAAIDTEIGQLAVLGTAGVDITTVSNIGTDGADVSTVAGITAGDVSKVAIIPTGDVTKVAIIPTGDVAKVAVIATGDVTKVAVIATGDVTKVAAIATGDVTKVAAITAGDVTKVADVDGEVALVSAIDGEVALLGTTNMAHATTGHLALLGTANMATDVTGHLARLGTSTVVTNVGLVAGQISPTNNVATVAGSIADVNRYAQEYTIASSAPGSPSEGDLWYDSTNNVLKFHNGTTFAAISAPTHNSMVDDTTPQLGGDLDLNSNDITGTGVIPAANLTGTAQVTLDVLATLITTSTTNGHIGFDKGITEKIGTSSASGTTVTVDLSTGNFFEVDLGGLSGNVSTFTINNPNATSGQVNNFVIKCKQHGSGGDFIFSWGSLSAIDWPEQTGPDMTLTANRYDIYSFTSYNNGTNWLGAVVGQDYSY